MMREILSEVLAALENGGPCVLCSLVETRGSTPQKAGAAMLVFPDGSQCGTLGGGCVEAEVKQRALRLLDSGRPELLTFMLDDNYGWDDGLICGGRMNVIAQPLANKTGASGAPELPYFQSFRTLVENGEGCIEAVLTSAMSDAPVGARYLFDADHICRGRLHGNSPPGEVSDPLPNLHERPKAFSRHSVAYLPVLPRVRLLIVGGGHVGQAVGRFAAETDFDVWVLDDREAFASRERFPSAERLIVGDIGRKLQELKADTITP